MTEKQIKRTRWYKWFLKESPTAIDEAIGYALNPSTRYTLCHTSDSGPLLWAIKPYPDPYEYTGGFWMDARPTKKEALALCRRMGWRVKKG